LFNKCVFENGTESNMLYRSLAKILYVNGRVVTQNIDKVNEDFIEKFSNTYQKRKVFRRTAVMGKAEKQYY